MMRYDSRNKVLILTGCMMGRFWCSRIIERMRFYFSTKRKRAISLGDFALCEDLTALRDNLSAESVAWGCIAVFPSFILF